jgi:hypothetical protein
MRDSKIVVQRHNDILVTIARSAPIETTIIVKLINQTIEPLSVLKKKASDVLGTTPTVPNIAPSVNFY